MADNSISDADFVNSFLKAARLRKISAVVMYGTQEGRSAKLRLVSNAGEGPTQGVLAWLRAQPDPHVETPPAEPEPAQ
jgi:hypothetical protein